MPALDLLTLLPVSFLLCLVLRRLSSLVHQSGSLPLPPGPPASWFGGVQLPQTYPWLTYADWRETYGDIIYIRVYGNPILVINSAKVASDLLERRGQIYSSRPLRTMVVELAGWDWLFSSMPYGNLWKKHRKLFLKYFRPKNPSHHALQIRETHALLRNLLKHPQNFRYHIRETAATIILYLTYGHEVAQQSNYFVLLVDKAVAGLANAGIFGTYLVDYIPILKHIPAWFPGAGFKRKAKEWRKASRGMVDEPFSLARKDFYAGTASKSLVTDEMERQITAATCGEEDVIKNVAATSFAAGADTVVSALLSFLLAMMAYPEIQRRAQQELDSNLGRRLPELSDRDRLPYIEAICYELLRWNPVTPLGIAHYVIKNDEYQGYHIPKGTTVLPNVWAMLHDPVQYPEPFRFRPERYMDRERNVNDGINRHPDAAFGFGRRACPGRWFAFDSLWIAVASILSVFDVLKAVDEEGNTIEPQIQYSSALLR
ncbi:hypothetical protein AX16_009680 [Volvariella volvacea WC 439]|nr:hypothetical protein AX16_009680 [Volvariella volvacea WC 439]